MTKLLVFSAFFIFALGAFLCSALGREKAISRTLAEEPENLVQNPGFEDVGNSNFPVGWVPDRGGEFKQIKVAVDSAIKHSGNNSLRIGVNPQSFAICDSAQITLKPNTKYYLTWQCKTVNFKTARAYVFLRTNMSQRTMENADQFSSQDWKLHVTEYTTTADEISTSVVLTTHAIGEPKGECYAYFDDISVYEGTLPKLLKEKYEQDKINSKGIFNNTASVFLKNAKLTVWGDTLEARIYKEDGVPGYAGANYKRPVDATTQAAPEAPSSAGALRPGESPRRARVPPLLKIGDFFRDFYNRLAKKTESISVSAARGEEDFIQVVITPKKDTDNITIEAVDFVGAGTIPSSIVRYWPVGYVPVKTLKTKDSIRLGLTPDPLLNPTPVSAPKGLNTLFLVGFKIPRDAKAGNYQGALLIKTGATELAKITVSLRVYNFSLPDDPTFRSVVRYEPNLLSKWDKRSLLEIEKDICRVMYDHGIRGNCADTTVKSRIVDGKVVCDFTEFDKRLEWVFKNLNFNAFILGPCFGGGTSAGWQPSKWNGLTPFVDKEFEPLFIDYIRQVAEHLKQKGWFSSAYFYPWDEPEPDYFDKVVALQKMALRAEPKLKIWETTSPSHQAFWGVVNAWAVPFCRPHFDEESVENRRAAGDEIWVYNMIASLEATPQEHLLWFWQAFHYGASGALLWDINYYHKINPWEDITPAPYPIGRDGKTLFYYSAGDAILIYPNPKGDGIPFSSLRFKLIKKGIDDYEYFTILQNLLEQEARKNNAADPKAEAKKQVKELTSVIVKDLNQYDQNPLDIEKIRETVAQKIETLQK